MAEIGAPVWWVGDGVDHGGGPVLIAGVLHALVGPTHGGVAQVAQPGTFFFIVG